MENNLKIIFSFLIIVYIYLLYRDICNKKNKSNTKVENFNKDSIKITESLKNLGILAMKLQDKNKLILPSNIEVNGMIKVKKSMEIGSPKENINDMKMKLLNNGTLKTTNLNTHELTIPNFITFVENGKDENGKEFTLNYENLKFGNIEVTNTGTEGEVPYEEFWDKWHYKVLAKNKFTALKYHYWDENGPIRPYGRDYLTEDSPGYKIFLAKKHILINLSTGDFININGFGPDTPYSNLVKTDWRAEWCSGDGVLIDEYIKAVYNKPYTC